MKYAVIKTGGKQYKVIEGDIIEVDKLELKDENVVFDSVLLIVEDENLTVGKPFIEGAKVKAKLLEQKQGKKVRVAKFKSKVRYRRVSGFRAKLSKVQIEKIESTVKESVKKEVKSPSTVKEKPKKVSKKA
jgi:large subunit ribosomal protein L21